MSVSVDLSDLVDDLKAELNVPGNNSYPDATEDEWLNQMRNSFWEVVLDGLITGYTESDGIIKPNSSSGQKLGRDFQQIIIFYAGIRVVRNQLRDIQTVFRTKAGPVEYEVQQSAQVLKTLLDELTNRRKFILQRLSDGGSSDAYYVDSLIARDDSINYGFTYWVGQ